MLLWIIALVIVWCVFMHWLYYCVMYSFNIYIHTFVLFLDVYTCSAVLSKVKVFNLHMPKIKHTWIATVQYLASWCLSHLRFIMWEQCCLFGLVPIWNKVKLNNDHLKLGLKLIIEM